MQAKSRVECYSLVGPFIPFDSCSLEELQRVLFFGLLNIYDNSSKRMKILQYVDQVIIPKAPKFNLGHRKGEGGIEMKRETDTIPLYHAV